jgi:Xaa-Pro dipeptidase
MLDDRPSLPFSPQEFAARLAAARREMARQDLDLLLLVAPANTYYLTGFGTGSAASANFLVLPIEAEPFWVMRTTETSNIRLGPSGLVPNDAVTVGDSDDVIAVLTRSILERGLQARRIGIEGEAQAFTVGHYIRLSSGLPGARLIDAAGLVERLRRIKSPAELNFMRKAGAMTAKAISAGFDALREGATDTDIAASALDAALRAGSERMAAQPYIVSGPGSARAHSSWSARKVQRGDIVDVELACCVARYHVPTFRVLSLGQPSSDALRMHEASLAGLEAGLSGIKPGITSHEADQIVRDAIARTGFGDEFVVRAAYGIGIAFSGSWGESAVASLRPGDDLVVEEGMCFHLVPALYRYGVGCICCSMPIEVTANGALPLTPLEPILMVAP